MRYRVFVYACLLAATGCCRHPMHVCTDSRVTVSGPVAANVTADLQPRRNVGPLVEMTVGGGPTHSSFPKLALLDVDGLLLNANLIGPYSEGENPVALFREKLDAVASDPQIRAVVLRINTPGGGVTATDLMWHELQTFRTRTGLPVVAYLMDVAAGGGYYLATAADLIYAHPTTVTGGIGVILNLYNLQETMAQFNVLGQSIKAGDNIDMGTSTQALTDDARNWLQAMADQFHQRFKWVVAHRRGAVKADDAAIFDGRVFAAGEARALGLIDQIGYLEDAIRAAQDQARQGPLRVVMFHRQNDPARSPYAITANSPLQSKWLPVSIPGFERSRLPMFLYLWQLDPTLERIGGQ